MPMPRHAAIMIRHERSRRAATCAIIYVVTPMRCFQLDAERAAVLRDDDIDRNHNNPNVTAVLQ